MDQELWIELLIGCMCSSVHLVVFTPQMATLFCMKRRRGCNHESVMSNQKSDSVSLCIFTWNAKFCPNLIWNSWNHLLKSFNPMRTIKRWVAIWCQFLFPKFHIDLLEEYRSVERHVGRVKESWELLVGEHCNVQWSPCTVCDPAPSLVHNESSEFVQY